MFLQIKNKTICLDKLLGIAVNIAKRARSTNTDSIDIYTDSLVQQKVVRWNILKKQQLINREQQNLVNSTKGRFLAGLKTTVSKIRDPNKTPICVDVKNLNNYQIDNLLESALEQENFVDFYEIINQIIEYKNLPSEEVIKEVLEIISDRGDLATLMKFVKVVEDADHDIYERNCNFKVFVLNSHWNNNNVKTTIEGVKEIYENHKIDEKIFTQLRDFLNSILYETINHKSEAVLISLKNLAEFVFYKYNDSYLIYSVWKRCFDSHWYSDKLLADQLLYKFEKLQKILSVESNLLCYSYLRAKNIESVHRLIEVFLKFDMHKQVESTLKVLLNYQLYRRDLRAASEVVKFCVTLEINLSDEENKKFIALMLNKPFEPAKKEIKVPNYQYKF